MKTRRAALAAAALIIACTPSNSSTGSPAPAASASATPLSERLNVPDSTPVILYHDPADFDQLDGMTWDGKVKGRIGPGFARGGVPNGQGTLFWTLSDIRDRTDRVIAPLDSLNATAYWADDGRHLCSLARTGSRDTQSEAELTISLPGQAAVDVARIGTFWPAGLNAGGPYVVACSVEADRAVIVQSAGQGLGTARYWVVQLSTGRVLWSRVPTGAVQLTASHDARLIVENRTDGPSPVYGADGSVVATVNGWISRFSWDGTLAVTSPTWTGGQVSVVTWRDGTIVWRGPPGTAFGYESGVTEPNGTHLAIGVRDPAFPQTAGFPPDDMFIVGPDGKVTFQQKNIVLFPTL